MKSVLILIVIAGMGTFGTYGLADEGLPISVSDPIVLRNARVQSVERSAPPVNQSDEGVMRPELIASLLTFGYFAHRYRSRHAR